MLEMVVYMQPQGGILSTVVNSFSQQGSLLLNEIKDMPIYDDSNTKRTFLGKLKIQMFDKY